MPAERLVFLDESSAKTHMTRTHGRTPLGVLVADKVPNGRGRTTTMVSAVRTDGPFAAAAVNGPFDTDVFLAYLEQVLTPELCDGDVVVMDNLTPHKHPKARTLIESAGAAVLYLSPSSPDLNPIENLWSKVKPVKQGPASAAEHRGSNVRNAPGRDP